MVSVTSENKAGEARDAGSGKSLESALQRLKPGVSDHLAGEKDMVKSELQPYLPMELIGGSVPYVPGTEEEAVWNAAAQACATEKVHFAYSVEGKRVWYLACPSSSLASNPDSWCPLAAALPGQSEFWDKETVYLYEQEGVASALRWDAETGRMQVYLGAARTILPRIQSMDANFVTVNPEVAKVVPWKNRALFSEKLARATSRVLLLSGLGVSFMAIIILVFQYLSVNMMRRDLSQVKQETREASSKLMVDAARSMQSDIFKHMVRIQELLDGLRKIDGTLVRYEVDKNRVQWEALVPPAFGQAKADGRGGVGVVRGEVVPGIEEDGRVRIRGTR